MMFRCTLLGAAAAAPLMLPAALSAQTAPLVAMASAGHSAKGARADNLGAKEEADTALMTRAENLSAQANAPHQPERAIFADVIMVNAPHAERGVSDPSSSTLQPPRQIALPADAAALAARVPGAALVGNGPLSGQLNYRGLFGERVLGTINGQRFASGGPNAMDPPLHYAPSVLVERIEVARGVGPVSAGPGLAGMVNAQLRQMRFADHAGTDHGAIAAEASGTAQARGADESVAIGALAGVASATWRMGVIASRERGEDYRFPGGVVAGSSFARDTIGVHGGLRLGQGEVFAEYRRHETGPSGNPPFALDIVYFNTDFVQGGYRGDLAPDLHLEARVGHVAVRHLMDNQTLRRPPAATMQARSTMANADTLTADAALRVGSASRHLRIGIDLEHTDRFVRITNPFNANFFLDAQPDLAQRRWGGFAQLRDEFAGAQFELGGRVDHIAQSGGLPELGSAVPMGPRNLAALFAASARATSDTVFDVVWRGWLPGEAITPHVVMARKTRVPSLLERFAWLPTEASFGLADGNIYAGNPDLVPEVAWIGEVGADLALGAITLRPTVFYRRVENFIQGTPFDATPGVIDTMVEMVAGMNGDPTPLLFRNVEADLMGIDLDFSARLTPQLLIEGTGSYVRGRRLDVDDDLFRLPPANMRVAAIWQEARWALGAEMIAAADQNRISATNGETPGLGYTVFGLFGEFNLSPGLALSAGVENLFDRFYQPHLAGLNRVGASSVAPGERLPGVGRGAWLRLAARL